MVSVEKARHGIVLLLLLLVPMGAVPLGLSSAETGFEGPGIADFVVTCDGATCSFDATAAPPDVAHIHWAFGDGASATARTFIHHYPHAGAFTPCLTVYAEDGAHAKACQELYLDSVQYAEDFDAGTAPGWSLDGLWRIDDTCVPPAQGAHYLGYHDALLCNYQTLGRTTGIASFSVDLTDTTQATLRFQTRWEVETTQGDTGRDFMRVQVKADARPEIFTVRNWDSRSGDRLEWTPETVDLGRFTGDTITVRFQFDAANLLLNHHRGWYIDDVRILSDQSRIDPHPTAHFTHTCDVTDCSFDGSGSAHDRAIAQWAWDLGDGQNASGEQVTHNYAANGTYHVRLTVTDHNGGVATTGTDIWVGPVAPQAAFTHTCSDLTCHFDADLSRPDGSIIAYHWAFGDNTTANGATVYHTYTERGVYPVTLTITTDTGTEDSVTRMIGAGDPTGAPVWPIE